MTKIKAASTNQHNRKALNDFCGVMYAIDILGGRWKLMILYKLEKKTMRFLELKKKLPEISDRMLTLHLRELERDGMIRREVFAEVPPRVEYSLTESARELVPVWLQLEKWGLRHRDLRAAADAVTQH
ncbi:helix-turn-helix domain-containing protein [uncultured Chitinophaga sp.]|jgi:Predicted transcriptional regulators|uniref:winged helix-turn-helix transcriptional regulator n=1 Tax=uncultured Chitinophaga sp. TaxID=339340 RepID=UPI0026321D0D|nr:helix-turn-helix domain-containing protein [uncultured Chitinophaga sp.]